MTNLDYLYNPDSSCVFFNGNYFVDKNLGFQIIEHGVILPHSIRRIRNELTDLGGIIDGNGKYVTSSSLYYGINEVYTPLPEAIYCSSETAIYLGMFHHTWEHDLTDNLSRLWFLKSEIFKSEFKNCPIVYVPYREEKELYGGENLQSKNQLSYVLKTLDFGVSFITRFRRLLEILEIDADLIQAITKPTRFEKIVMPDEAFLSHRPTKGFTKEYREMIEQVRNFALKNRTPTSCKKIYYFQEKGQIGEERLAEYFYSKDYEIVHPEKLTLDEQLNLLINAENFASTTDSISYNSIFLRDTAEAIFIPGYVNRFTEELFTLNQVHPLNIHYIDSTMSIFATWKDSFCYIISEQLKNFFGDKWNGYDEEDFENFLKYHKLSASKGKPINRNIKRDYEKVFSDFMTQLRKREDLIADYEFCSDWTKRPLLYYQTHVAREGWCAWKSENQISNPINSKNTVQGIKLDFPEKFYDVYCAVYDTQKDGWVEEVITSYSAMGRDRKEITGIKIRLDEAGAEKFDILYRVHKLDGEWTDWAKNGEEIFLEDVKLNAVQIKLEDKFAEVEQEITRPQLTYKTHVSNFGWGEWINENRFSNPLDLKKDIQAIRINFSEPLHDVYYSVYYNEEEGWSKEVSNSQQAGTTGKEKPVKGIKIRLDDEVAKKFDVLYRIHKFNDEWTAWAKNGEELLSDGQKLNAIQIKLRDL